MLSASLSSAVVLSLFCGPLLVAAVFDLASFRIPNLLNLAFALLFPVAALLSPQPVDWLSHLAAGVVVFVGATILYLMGWLGGGDVKLIAAAALWFGLPGLLPFLTWVGVAGGVFSLLLLLGRRQAVANVLLALWRVPKLLQPGAPVPYGVAIAAGGLAAAGFLPLV